MAYFRFTLISSLCIFICACGDFQENVNSSDQAPLIETRASVKEFVDHFSQQGQKCFSDVANHALTLKQRVIDFTNNVQQKTWDDIQKEWAASEFLWSKCAVFLAVGEHYSKEVKQRQYNVAYWPVFAGYIDYMPEYPTAGLVYDTMLPITKTTLVEQHQLYSNDQASIGFYVIGVLLGKESDKSLSDYQPLKNLSANIEDHQNIVKRRQSYLSIATELWLEDFGRYVSTWMSESNRELNYNTLASSIIDAAVSAIEQERLSHSVNLKDEQLSRTFFKGLLDYMAIDSSYNILQSLSDVPAEQVSKFGQTVHGLRESISQESPWGSKEWQEKFLAEMAVLKRLYN